MSCSRLSRSQQQGFLTSEHRPRQRAGSL